MPIETRTVLTCGHCGSPKAEANGWYILDVSPRLIAILSSSNTEQPLTNKMSTSEGRTIDCACGRECAIKMVSEALANLKHTDHASHDPKPTPRRWRKGKPT